MIAAKNRFGLIGDIHAEDDVLEQVLDEMQGIGVTRLFCSGDICDGPGSVDRCCELLRDRSVQVVMGNHDRWLVSDTMRTLVDATPRESVKAETLVYLADLPTTRTIETGHGKALLCHGMGKNDMAKVELDDFGYAIEVNSDLQELFRSEFCYVINGHTHDPGVRHFDDLTVINAGTLKIHKAAYVIADFDHLIASCYRLSRDAKRFELTDTWSLRRHG